MKLDRVRALTLKEGREILRDRYLAPLLVFSWLGILVILLAFTGYVSSSEATASHFLRDQEPPSCSVPPGASVIQRALFTTAAWWPAVFVSLLAVLTGGLMGIDSFVGERERGTSEILLSQPLTAAEILIGKLLAPTGLATVLIWSFAILFLAVGGPIANRASPGLVVPSLSWIAAVFVGGPLFALIGAVSSVLVSLRVSSLRAGFGASSLIAIFGTSLLIPWLQVALCDPRLTGLLLVAQAGIAAAMLALARFLFDRERLLLG